MRSASSPALPGLLPPPPARCSLATCMRTCSDVDLGVVGATGNNPLQILASALRKQGVARYHHVDTIPKARVPIVKLVDAGTPLLTATVSPREPNKSTAYVEMDRGELQRGYQLCILGKWHRQYGHHQGDNPLRSRFVDSALLTISSSRHSFSSAFPERSGRNPSSGPPSEDVSAPARA